MCKVVTLLYHRVNNLENDRQMLGVTPNNFYLQMLYLKRNYNIVRFEQDWNKLDKSAVCITFDDGYMDNFTNALPILQELDIPATIFVSTSTINTSREFWWDELDRLLLVDDKKYKKTFELKDELFSCQWLTETYHDREELYDTLHWLMYDKISVGKREEWMAELRKWAEVGAVGREQNYGLQTDYEIMNSPLLTIGAHTVNHPSLKNLKEQEQRYEISQSIKDLETLIGEKVTVFSYPFGTINDFDETTIEICKSEHICKAAANFPGIWDCQCDEYKIPRNIVRNWGIKEYIKKVEGFWRMG